MGETKASSGVSGNNKKRANASVENVSMEVINQDIVKFTGGKELYVDYIGFEPTPERITTQESDTGNNSEASGTRPTKAGDYTTVDASGSKPLSDVIKECVIVKAKTKTKLKSAEKEDKEEQNIDEEQK